MDKIMDDPADCESHTFEEYDHVMFALRKALRQEMEHINLYFVQRVTGFGISKVARMMFVLSKHGAIESKETDNETWQSMQGDRKILIVNQLDS